MAQAGGHSEVDLRVFVFVLRVKRKLELENGRELSLGSIRPSTWGAERSSSSPSTTMRRVGFKDELRSEDGEQVVFYMRGREAWTIISCNTEYRRMVEFCRRKTSLYAMSLCFRSTYPRWRGLELDLTGQGQGAF